MKKHEYKNIINLCFVVLVSCFLFSTLFAVALNSSQFSISSYGTIANPNSPLAGLPIANYYVIESSSIYYAYNGNNPQAFLINVNAATVISAVLGRMMAGQSIVINGSILLDSEIRVPLSNVKIDWWKSNVTVTANRGIVISNHDNITLINGNFWGRNDSETEPGQCALLGSEANYITVANAAFHKFSYIQGVIKLDLGSHISIVNNTFTNNWNNYGVVFNAVSDSVIANNMIDSDHAGSAIGVFGDESTLGANKNVTIANNTLLNTGWALGHMYHVIYVTCTNNTDIYGNTIINATGSTAITIKSPNTLFHDNTLIGIGAHCFQIWQETGPAESVNGSKIYGNTIMGIDGGSSYYAFYLNSADERSISGLLIDNNTVSGFYGFVRLNDGTAPGSFIVNTTIQRNVVSNCRKGIIIGVGDGRSYVANVNILSNKFTDIGSPTLYIDTPTPNVLIAYNTLSSCTAPVIQNFTSSIWIHDNIGLTDYIGPYYSP